jgi:phosphoglycolate phosphatase
MHRSAALSGRPRRPLDVIVVGDTPHDVAAAKAHGCRAVAVATGRSSFAELADCGPDLTLQDLSDHPTLLRFLGLPAPSAPARN